MDPKQTEFGITSNGKCEMRKLCMNGDVCIYRRQRISGAPPRPSYFKQLLTIVGNLGANGVLIEWEDMFPYTGALKRIRNGNAYTVDETLDILQHAHSLGLSVIPLVQTVGHLEWILKTKEFANLRENTSYPMVACIGNQETRGLILDSINQVMALHSKIQMPYIHIGADEVFQIGQCEANRKLLPVKYGNNTKRLMFDHLRTIATNITESFPKTKVLVWFDELMYVEKSLIKEYGLDRLVVPVVWKYTTNLEKDLPTKMWQELAASFPTVWGASAFKDADAEMILRALKCPDDVTINQLISNEDNCHFAGYKVRDSIRDFILVKQQYENASWVHNREAAYLQQSQMRLNASNPFYVDAIGNSYRRSLARLDKIIEQLRSSMNDIFYNDVFVEFTTDYVSPFYNDLKERLASIKAIDVQRTYRARPWFRR
ncbi:unnamed protein product [Heligmosomoides polygyrus]|uniref:beta-N-acetylhexosaminidase n=1 Tax=Heligmosomoides polygyrus TaxID=6339 RepID=A0A3P7XM01_HELPZ|nr:unnamed protein product [Heligmosomoides polygyrus]